MMNKYLKLNEIKSIIIIINFMFFNNYFGDKTKVKQLGSGNCKICGSVNTTARSCPLNDKAKVVNGVR